MNEKTKPAYRKVVADLHDCEERYSTLVNSLDGPEDARVKSIFAALKSEVAHRRRIEAELLAAVESERQRIGRDLHEDLCQRLGAAALTASVVAKKIRGENPEVSADLEKIPRLINDTIESCSSIARGLHPVTLEANGLPAALEELASKMPNGVKVLWPTGDKIGLSVAVALHLYRIIEEGVDNAVTHAAATNIVVELEAGTHQATVAIKDDGKGFAEKSVNQGMGLRNMRYRAGVIGAKLTFRPRANGGTCVECRLPLEATKNADSSKTKAGTDP
jgi:two-component system sensor kinase FixL